MIKTLTPYIALVALGVLMGTQQKSIDNLQTVVDSQQKLIESHRAVLLNHNKVLIAVEDVLEAIWEKVNKNFT